MDRGGNQAGAAYGSSVATAGDVNGDGCDDLIAGGDGYSFGQANEGRAVVFPGSASGLSVTPIWVGEGNQADAAFGYSVGRAGRVNGAVDQVIVGAKGFDHGEQDEGAAIVLGRG